MMRATRCFITALAGLTAFSAATLPADALRSAPPSVASEGSSPDARAQKAFEEGRAHFALQQYDQAIERLDVAVHLDAQMAEAFYYLGACHDALAGPRWHAVLAPPPELPPPPPPPPGSPRLPPPPRVPESRPPPPADPKLLEHRHKALEAYAASLLVNRGDTEGQRRAKQLAFRAILEIDYGLPTPSTTNPTRAREYAEGSLDRDDLILLARVNERIERYAAAEGFYKRLFEEHASDSAACLALAGLYLRPIWGGAQRFDDAIVTMERCAAIDARDPSGYQHVARFLWDKAYRDPRLRQEEKLAYANRGLAMVDRSLAVKGDDVEALVYKGLLLRVKASATADAARRAQLLVEADALHTQAMEARAAERHAPAVASSGPLRVGGPIGEPKKIKHVDPVHPEGTDASGVVILECTIGPDGRVTGVKMLRGIPGLEDAAITAVKQWVYAPTLVDGAPVAVVLTVVVRFPPAAPSRR